MTPDDEPPAGTRILIADDHNSFRSGLRACSGRPTACSSLAKRRRDPKPSARSRRSIRTSC